MNERRVFIRKLGGLGALFALWTTAGKTRAAATGEISLPAPAPGRFDGRFFHVVFFWLKDCSEETRDRFLHELTSFTDGVEQINSRHIGTPAATDRDVIDNTWSYSLILTFDSKREQDLYQDHPLHKRFIENASHLWERVQVYDSTEAPGV